MTPDLWVPGSTSDQGPRKHYQGEVLLLAALPETNVLEGVTFEDCKLRGPAVLLPDDGGSFVGCDWGGPPNVVWWDRWPEEVAGVLKLRDCHFIRCQFFGVGFLGDADTIARMQEHTET